MPHHNAKLRPHLNHCSGAALAPSHLRRVQKRVGAQANVNERAEIDDILDDPEQLVSNSEIRQIAAMTSARRRLGGVGVAEARRKPAAALLALPLRDIELIGPRSPLPGSSGGNHGRD